MASGILGQSDEIFDNLLNVTIKINRTNQRIEYQTSKYYMWSVIFSIVFYIFTLYELLSNTLGLMYLRKLSAQYKREELEGEGVRYDAETSEGIRIRLLTEEEMQSIKGPLFAIAVVTAIELICCTCLLYGVIMGDPIWVLSFVGYVLVFTFFKFVSGLNKVVAMLERKNIKGAGNYCGSMSVLIFVDGLVLVILFNYFADLIGAKKLQLADPMPYDSDDHSYFEAIVTTGKPR